jgi:hypothetical protein
MLKKYGSLENLNMSANGTIILADKPMLQHFMVVHGICILYRYIGLFVGEYRSTNGESLHQLGSSNIPAKVVKQWLTNKRRDFKFSRQL